MKIVTQVSLVVAIVVALGHDGSAKDINFGWPSGEGWSSQPYKAAAERGFFEREGLKVSMVTFRGTNLMLAALISGDLDYMTILPFAVGASRAWCAG